MSDSIQIKIEKLKRQLIGGRTDHFAEVEQWEKDLKKKMLVKNIAEHPAVQELRTRLRERIEASEVVLKNDRSVTAEERFKLFERKEEDRWLLSFFESAEQGVASLEKSLDYYLTKDSA